MGIEIRDYDPAWPDLAVRALDEVTAALPGLIAMGEHVGSTSVPGLAAKPVIDMMVATECLDTVLAAEAALFDRGYRRIDIGMPERLFYRRVGVPVGYHLHVVTVASWATRNERLLRDHLRETPADCERYAGLKRRLAGTAPDADAYTRAKTALIQEMVDEARSRRGLPRVNVWEA